MLLAVHISDGVLTPEWWLGGYAVALALLAVSAWRVRDEEIPRIALLTATFFIVSLIHVRAGFVSIHLLMNGLVGIVLGRRAPLAIFCGLFLQYWLINHGGLQTLGVNTCVMSLPALLFWVVFRASQRLPWLKHPWFRSFLVFASMLTWTLGAVFSLYLFIDNSLAQMETLRTNRAWDVTWHPSTLTAAVAVGVVVAWVEAHLENAPEFPLGLLLGVLAVLTTVGLNFAVLIWGAESFGPVPPLVILMAHLPIAVFEGIVLGFTLGFLAKVKPELLGLTTPTNQNSLAFSRSQKTDSG